MVVSPMCLGDYYIIECGEKPLARSTGWRIDLSGCCYLNQMCLFGCGLCLNGILVSCKFCDTMKIPNGTLLLYVGRGAEAELKSMF